MNIDTVETKLNLTILYMSRQSTTISLTAVPQRHLFADRQMCLLSAVNVCCLADAVSHVAHNTLGICTVLT